MSIYKRHDEDLKNNVRSSDHNYKDDTLLDDTIFNEKYKIFVCINGGRKCTCGHLDHYRTQAVLLKKSEEDKKQMMNEMKKTHMEELIEQANKFQNIIDEQNKKLNEANQKLQYLEEEAQRTQFNKDQKKYTKKKLKIIF